MIDISQNCIQILKLLRPTNSSVVVGENLSSHPAIQVFFDGYGEDEESGEADDTSVEKFVLMVDINSGKDNFKMAPHEVSFGLIEGRPSELQIYAIYDVTSKRWHVDDPEIDESSDFNLLELDEILGKIYTSIHKATPSLLPPSAPWPFAAKSSTPKKKSPKKS